MALEPFRIHLPDERLELLRERLRTTVWADEPAAGADAWGLGVPGSYLRELVAHWLDDFDWRAQEEAMNRFPHLRGDIGGVTVHADPRARLGTGADRCRWCSRTAGRGRSGTSPR